MKEFKKHTIWSNLNLELEDWKNYFEENEIPEDEQYEAMNIMNYEYLDDERLNLSSIKGKILAIADLGLWNGRREGYKIYNSFEDALYSDCDYCEWYVDRTGMQFTGHHHDGTNYIKYRLIKEDTNTDTLEDKLSDWIFNGKPYPENYIKNKTSNLYQPIAKIYGF